MAKMSKYDVFDNFFKEKQTDTSKVCIVMQHTPDPDAIGSALALEWLLEEKYDLPCDIFYSGEASHPQNQTELNVLDISLKHKSSFKMDEYNVFVTVVAVPQNTGFGEVEKWDADRKSVV